MTAAPETTTDDRAAARRALLEQRLRRRAQGPAAGADVIGARPADAAVPLSYQQERVWFMEQFAPGTCSYNIPVPLRLRGPLDDAALRAALADLPVRHEALRMRFPSDVDGQPTVRVADAVEVPLRRASAPDEHAAQQLAEAFAREPFDLVAGPLLHALLVSFDGDPEHHLLVVSTHHIVGDGWSVDLLQRDLAGAYHARRAGVEPPTGDADRIDYGDFAHWQRATLAGSALDAQLEHWSTELTGVEPLELPVDRPRPATQTFDGDVHEFTLDRADTDALGALGTEHGATLFMTLLAAYQVLLHRYSGQDDFAVGVSSAGRARRELDGVLGMFVNMLPMRAALGDDVAFTEHLDRTRRRVLDAFDHQDVPFERLVQALGVPRDVSRSPVFQAMFALQNYEMGRMGRAGTSDLAISWEPTELKATRFDLEFRVVEVPTGLLCSFVYNTALFDPATIDRMARHLTVLLRSVAATPSAAISALPMADDAERAELVGWNETTTDYPDAATLHGLVAEQIARTPDAVAVVFPGTREDPGARAELTFAELDVRANRVAHRLRALGAGPGVLVGVCVPRSLDLVVSLLGVLRSGAAYVPLDPEYPADRLGFMLDDAAAPVVLVARELRDVLPAELAATVLFADDEAEWAGQPDTAPESAVSADDPAYVIYTSGSTGRPKGVPNAHRGIVNRLDWMQRTYRLDGTDAVLQKTPAGFDVSVWEFFWPLLSGARLVLAEPGGHKDAAYLGELLVAERITTAHFVPSMLTVFLSQDVPALPALRRVICSGEELPVASATDFLAAVPGCELHNLYGPTEAAIDVTAYRCTAEALDGVATVPLGTPIQNIRIHVLDRAGRPTPVGVPGELVIAGVGVALGYQHRPELTAEKFIADPAPVAGDAPGEGRAYRTGDLARWLPNGLVEFLGRIDQQVKIRGLRIELGEIDAVLRRQAGVRDVAVVVREDSPGDKRLVAYPVGDPGTEPDPDALRTALKEVLPEYMVPTAFVALDALPLTPNGKLDRKALPAPTVQRAAGTELVEPRTDVERLLAGLWREVLGIADGDPLGIDDDFFDLGGHSLLATQVVAKIRQAGESGTLGADSRPVGVMDLFQNRTIRDLATFMSADPADDGPRRLLYELTKPTPAATRTLTYVCVPYGGGSAIVYQPLADALPKGYSLYSVAIPGHDVGLTEEALPFDALVARIGDEILERVEGPLALYGHCGVGNAISFGVARYLEERGRQLEAVYNGAIFPFARLGGRLGQWRTRMEAMRSNRHYASWLKGMGVDTDELEPEQADRIISNMRSDSRAAEEYFTGLLDRRVDKLRAPVVSIVGSEDPVTDYHGERYREWGFLTDTMSLVVLDRAGHFFLRYRADELAEIVTQVHPAVAARDTDALPAPGTGPDGTDPAWALHEVHRETEVDESEVVKPTVGRFFGVTAGQLVSVTGSTLAGFAIPIWLYTQTGSVTNLGLLWSLSLLCGVLTLPVAGALVDRGDRRRIMMTASCVAGSVQLTLAILIGTGVVQLWNIYVLLAVSAVATSFQRIAFQSSVPQLVPKRYLGHAMGIAQLTNGVALLIMPLLAAGLLATISISGILGIAVGSYALAVVGLAFVRFPDLMGWRPREPLPTAIANGLRYSWNHRGFRTMLAYFALANVFLAPALVLVSPLVLSFGTISQVAQVAFAEAVGAVVGGLAMSLWGGPQRRRMVCVLVGNVGMAAGCLVVGLRPSLVVVMCGVFLLGMCMTLSQGIYATIVQVKVPQRYHGRVFAINQTITWSTLPIGFAVLAPLSVALFNPMLVDGGALADTVGTVIGTGEGRGIGFAYVVFALAMATINIGALGLRVLRRFDTEVPDSLPDDLIGMQERERVEAGEKVLAHG